MYGVGRRTLEEGLARGARWVLGAGSAAIGVVMLLMASEATRPEGHVVVGLFASAIAACCFLPGTARRVAGRVVGSMVFVAAVFYLVAASQALRASDATRDWSSLSDAIVFFVVAGLPGLCYASLGRLRWRENAD